MQPDFSEVESLISPCINAGALRLVSGKERAIDLVRRFSQSSAEVHQRIAAAVYSNNAWREGLEAEDWPILEELSSSAFWSVRFALLEALRWIQTEDRPITPDDAARALMLLFEMEVAGNVEVAEGWAGLFAGYHPTFPLKNLNDNQCRLILERLEGVPNIDYHSLKSTLVALSERLPVEVVQWLLRRFDYTDPNFEPVPYAHFRDNLGHGPSYDLKGLAKSPDYLNLLREVRSHALGADGRKSFFLPSLFEMLSLNYGPEGLQVLEEWIDEAERHSDAAKLQGVGLLLREASRGFAYAQVSFVSRLLSVAEGISDDALQTVRGDIYSSMTSGLIQSTPLQPAPVHVNQRDQCLRIAQELPPGSAEREFYESMSRDAEQMIAHELKRDEELDDEH